MKKLIVILVAVGVSMFSADKAQAEKREVFELCLVNAALADMLNGRLDKEIAQATYGADSYVAYFFMSEQEPTERIPTSLFFIMLADLVRRAETVSPEIEEEMVRYKKLLEQAIEAGNRLPVRAGRLR